MNGDNRATSVILVCKQCGKTFQPISGQVGRRCTCGGVLEPRKELPK
jgi:DNA-directed RNA polymerase subunit RPC12/RpoP